ncbi:MAG: alpha/beta hydrolase [Ktedonobacterales bacterium]
MTTRFITALDGVRIAYDLSGSGPLLLLLHSLPGQRASWHTYGYVEALSDTFTVALVDIRGFGESDAPDDPDAYNEERVLADMLAVADACGAERFFVWGHSYGATIARQIATKTDRVIRAVMAGGHFGAVFTEERVTPMLAELDPLVEAQREVRATGDLAALDALDVPPEEREDALAYPAASVAATLRALTQWEPVQPEQLRAPTLAYTGTRDERALVQLEAQRAALDAAHVQLVVFDGLDHGELISQRETVQPVVRRFLMGPQ